MAASSDYTAYLAAIPGMAEYRAKLAAKKIVISEEMLAIAAASAKTPSYSIMKPLSKSETVKTLTLPNPAIVDIEQERTDETEGGEGPGSEGSKKIGPGVYLAMIRKRYEAALYYSLYPDEAPTKEPSMSEKRDFEFRHKLTVEQRNSVTFVMRYKYLAYALVSPPNCPSFPIFLFYKGGRRDGDRNNIDRYDPVSLDALEFFHMEDVTQEEMLRSDVSTMEICSDEVPAEDDGADDADASRTYEAPKYDPRYPIHVFRRSGIGRELTNVVDPEKKTKRAKKLQPEQDVAASEDDKPAAAAVAAAEPNTGDNDADGGRTEEKQVLDRDEARKAKRREQLRNKKAAAAAAAAAAAVDRGERDDPMDLEAAVAADDTPRRVGEPALERLVPEQGPPFEISDSGDLALLGVPEMQRDDLATNCVWVDRAGSTGHVATPTIAELSSLCRLYVKDPPPYPGDLGIRYLLTVAGKHSIGVSLQPFVNTASKALVETPAVGSMDINQLTNALTPEIVNAAKDHVVRTALAEETLRMAHNQYLVKVAAASAPAHA